MSTALLEVDNLSVSYLGVVQALRNVSLRVGEGQVVAVLGANGAGKSTLLRAISGFVAADRARITSGQVRLGGRVVNGLSPDRIARLGLSLAPERDKVFPSLTVAENLKLGVQQNASRKSGDELRAYALDLFPILAGRSRQAAGFLSGGERQMLALATVLVSGAKLLLLDEMSLGLAPTVISELGAAIHRLNRERGLAFLLVDQSVAVAKRYADQAYLLENGSLVRGGRPEEVLAEDSVAGAYLGLDAARAPVVASPDETTSAPLEKPILEIDRVSLKFGGVTALADVSFTVPAGGIFGLIGPNGAGKTSLLNCINGFYTPTSGEIRFQSRTLTRVPPHRRAKDGISRTFQHVEVNREDTVLDNILLGRHVHIRAGLFACAVYWGRAAREEAKHRRRVEELIDLLGLDPYRVRLTGTLPYSAQKLVEIARALAMEPKLLLLDEPGSGMNPDEKAALAGAIATIHHELGVTQVLIEHDVRLISALCHHTAVLNFGRLIRTGSTAAVLADPEVAQAYLGESA